MAPVDTKYQDVKAKVDKLPPDDLGKVLEYIEFLTFKRQQAEPSEKRVVEPETPYRVVVKLEGLWEGHDISDEDIAAARKEMWAGFGEIDL